MGVRILSDKYDEMAVLYCSTSDWAFGPVFYGDKCGGPTASDFAEQFLKWLGDDVRTFPDVLLEKKYYEFQLLNWKQCPNCQIHLITEKDKLCEECLNEEEEKRCKPTSPIQVTNDVEKVAEMFEFCDEFTKHNHINPNCLFGDELNEDDVSLCLKCLCMTHTLRDNICGKCKKEKTKC